MTRSRPFVLLSVATSIDGYMDDTSPERLLLSNEDDFDRVDAVRASVDAILVGAETVRADKPRLLVRAQHRQRERLAAGKPASPIKVTLTTTNLDPTANFFTTGDCQKIVYTTTQAAPHIRAQLGHIATIVSAGEQAVDLPAMLEDLATRHGVERLMVEGGAKIHTQLLTAGLVDQLDLVIAPFFIGDPNAPHFPGPGVYPYTPKHPLALTRTTQIGDVALLQYHATTPDTRTNHH